ncbi:MAG: TonB-dependent receptor [Bacteroidia bacterium]|nr:MAG: TonB-dependent receptor [Bacteroidia bacterium]
MYKHIIHPGSLGHMLLKIVFLLLFIFYMQPTAAQTIEITGTVTDDQTGETLPGVNVVEVDTQRGVTTDANGVFNISVASEESMLRFSFIGYLTEQVQVNGRRIINVSLARDIVSLEEYVVVGYGQQSKRVVTGSISSIDSERLERIPVTSLDQAIQGQAAGVMVTQNSGAPGGAASIRVRGVFSVTGGNEPLYVIDGVPVNTNPMQVETTAGTQMGNALASLNPNDIASIEILKDASAAAIYGARASRGVVLITTKRGESGEGRISFDAYTGVQNVRKTYNMANATQWASYQNYLAETGNSAANPDWEDPTVLGEGTNWQDEIFGSAALQSYNLRFSGGTDRSTYSISGNYYDQDGIILNSNFKRYSIRANSDNKINSWFNAGSSIYFGRTDDNYVNTDDEYHSVIAEALRLSPALPLKDEDGNFAGPTGVFLPDIDNTVAKHTEKTQQLLRNKIIGSVYGEILFSDRLTFRSSFGIDYTNTNQIWFEPSFERGGMSNETARLNEWRMEHTQWINENILTYTNSFGKHNVNALLGFSAQEHFGNGVRISGNDLIDESLPAINLTNPDTRTGQGWKYHGAVLSQFGRITYDYDTKYLLTANIRRDGSSKFGPKNRYGVFPSVSVGWRPTEEPFLENLKDILEARLRFGYGQVGSDAIPDYFFIATLNTTDVYYVFNNENNEEVYAPGAVPTRLENPNLHWEASEEFNWGADFSFLNNRLNLTLEYFIKNTKDMLIQMPIPATSGITQWPWVNAGKVQNKGLEIELGFRKATGDFQYNISANFSSINNKVKYLASENDLYYFGLPGIGTFSLTREGYPIGAFYGFIVEGIFQDPEEIENLNQIDEEGNDIYYQHRNTAPGDYKFKDISGDGMVRPQTDRTIIGSPWPDFTFGLNMSFSYKNVDLVAVMDGVYGNDIVNMPKMWMESMGGRSNISQDAYENFWTPDRKSDTYPRPTIIDPNDNSRFSTRWLEDGSFLRIRTVTIGYTLPHHYANAMRMERLRVYISAQNLHVFTNYSGYDPEIGSYRQDARATGVDFGRYPSPRTISIGVNMGL